MSSSFEGYPNQQSFDYDYEQLRLLADIEEMRGQFLASAANLYSDPNTLNREAFDAWQNSWIDNLRQYIEFMLNSGGDIITEYLEMELIAQQYLKETSALNTTFADLTGNTELFYIEDVDVDEVVLRLIQPDADAADDDSAVVAQFMTTLSTDCDNFFVIAMTDASIDDDEENDFYPVDDLPSQDTQKHESRKKQIARQTLKVAGNIASMTLAVYLGNKLSQKR